MKFVSAAQPNNRMERNQFLATLIAQILCPLRLPHRLCQAFVRCIKDQYQKIQDWLFLQTILDNHCTRISTPQTLHIRFSSATFLTHHIDMLTTNLLLALAGVATTMAQIMPLPNNITFANNPIPGATRSASNGTSSQKDVIKADATSGRCGIHVVQSKCQASFDGIALRSVDWNGNIQYEGYCPGTVCAWPLLGMGDFLASVQQGYTTSISFSRQGTVSQDSWLNTDPEPRCHLGAWAGCLRQFDCGYACGKYSVPS